MKEYFHLTGGPVLSQATKDPLIHKNTRKNNPILSALLSLDWHKLFVIITDHEQM